MHKTIYKQKKEQSQFAFTPRKPVVVAKQLRQRWGSREKFLFWLLPQSTFVCLP
jgi:hypothetical protein